MAAQFGSVTVNSQNLMQGSPTAVERYFLFIGTGQAGHTNIEKILYLNTDSDLDTEFGTSSTAIKNNIAAARVQAGQNWSCAAIAISDGTHWDDMIDKAMLNGINPEKIIIIPPIGFNATTLQAKALSILNTYSRRVSFIVGLRPPIRTNEDPTLEETWTDYVDYCNGITIGISANRVSVVPQVLPNIVGIYAGRLCSDQTPPNSVADSPMRILTGALIGVDVNSFYTDKDGVAYSNAVGKTLVEQCRLTVPRTWNDLNGIYWSDGTLLDDHTGDYTVEENLRVVDKAARAVRRVALKMIADRKANSTPTGVSFAKSLLKKPLLDMSKSIVFNGATYVGEIQPPKKDDINIVWTDNSTMVIYMSVKPYSSAKTITANISLDLSNPV